MVINNPLEAKVKERKKKTLSVIYVFFTQNITDWKVWEKEINNNELK